MKFDKLRIVGGSSPVDLPKNDVDPLSQFILKDSTGLEPPDVDVFITNTPSGGFYKGTSAQLREIVLTVGLNPEWNIGQTPDDLRTMLYNLMTPVNDDHVKVQIILGTVVLAEAKGRVKRIQPSLHSKDPVVQITIPCIHPHLLAPTVTIDQPTFTNVGSSSKYFDVVNDGTAPSGAWFGFLFDADYSGTFTLMDDRSPARVIRVESSTFSPGGRLIIDTRPGSKGIWRIPNGSSEQTSLLDRMSSDSEWLFLHSGVNRFTINTRGVSWYFGVSYTKAYWGV